MSQVTFHAHRTAQAEALPAAKPHRLRAVMLSAVLAAVLLVLMHGLGLQWDEGPAMILGEVIGLLAPLAVIGLAALVVHALWSRLARR